MTLYLKKTVHWTKLIKLELRLNSNKLILLAWMVTNNTQSRVNFWSFEDYYYKLVKASPEVKWTLFFLRFYDQPKITFMPNLNLKTQNYNGSRELTLCVRWVELWFFKYYKLDMSKNGINWKFSILEIVIWKKDFVV